ncbi:uncharacterized protein [Nicotiana sylvestris]|uniref:uncharacterized protein n=1 Tax=Nicotiana sylvestris TaxID=4096 RepID=UPI00388CA1B7
MWRHYLYSIHVDIYMDHKNLQYVFKQKELNLRQRRLLKLLKDCDVDILYHPGKANDTTTSSLVTKVKKRQYEDPVATSAGYGRNSLFSLFYLSGATKMYHDIRKVYWWDVMKKDIVEFVAQCPNYKQVKIEHQKPGGLLHAIEIPT